jgi:hypothetical protein
MAHDDYYAEILIAIDGWVWNVADQPPQRRGKFQLTEKLLERWERITSSAATPRSWR